ncbi:cell division protein SepF [Amycolatopsis sp., V23-08]|uniref:Cell division protein SepF n=1 Tax=Amycolatopsis heterodermiae TaxID=3110235 RepID=A0ABU5RAI6_9PSEU|nr:cell division protein SepF [Amycolatopsis sp., V23-08]MEA5362774.1 cell division protein SepF [Amycolatopsis sp., V23-08]
MLEFWGGLAWPIATVLAVSVSCVFVDRALQNGGRRGRFQASLGQVKLKAAIDELDGILDAAIALNVQYANREVDPAVHLANALRVSPVDFASSALEIGRALRAGTVVIVDFAQLEIQAARRLADFCCGLACHAAAWLFRPSDTVLILTPPRRK